jgi:hypothetical protein
MVPCLKQRTSCYEIPRGLFINQFLNLRSTWIKSWTSLGVPHKRSGLALYFAIALTLEVASRKLTLLFFSTVQGVLLKRFQIRFYSTKGRRRFC